MSNDQLGPAILYLVQLRAADLGVKIVYKKDSRFWRGWEKFVRAITFGKVPFTNSNVTTTFNQTIYLSHMYYTYSDIEKANTLAHELVHTVQFKKMSIVGFLFVYLFAFFPIGLAYGRYWLERLAYSQGYLVAMTGLEGQERADMIEEYSNQFAYLMSFSGYGWCWPFKKATKAWMVKQLSN